MTLQLLPYELPYVLYEEYFIYLFISVKMDSRVQGASVQVAGQGLLRDGAGGARHRSVRRLHHRWPDTPGTTTEAAGTRVTA
jgi:hypothetical protein